MNALTSLAYLPAAAAVTANVSTVPHSLQVAMRACSLSLVALAVGSFEYHGPQHPTARLQHNVSVAATFVSLAFAIGEAARIRRGALPAERKRLASLGLAAAAAYIGGRSNSPFCKPHSLFQLHAVWHVLSALTVTELVEAVSNAVGVPRGNPPSRGVAE